MAHLIAKGGRKTLAILVLIGMEKAILKFVETDQLQMRDLKLPLNIAKAVEILGGSDAAEKFCEMQWEFLVPILRKDRSQRDFEYDKTTLPFMKSEQLKAGGFGDIFKIALYPFHQRLVDLDSRGNVSVFSMIQAQ